MDGESTVEFVEFGKGGPTTITEEPAAAAAEPAQEPVVEPVAEPEPVVEPEVIGPEIGTKEYWEAEATKDGWKPDTDYSGKPENFVDAETYVQRGKMMKPLKEALDKERASNEKLRRDTAKMLRETTVRISKQEKEKYEGYAARLKAAEKENFENADWDAIEAIKKKRAEVDRTIADLDKTLEEPQENSWNSPDHETVFESFIKDNDSWFGKDTEKTRKAEALGVGLGQMLMKEKGRALTHEEYKGVMDQVAEQFGKPESRPRIASVQTASHRPGKGNEGKTFGELPREAKEAFTTMFRHGHFGKDKSKAQARYATDYHNEAPYGAEED